jgi:hypothetical protein
MEAEQDVNWPRKRRDNQRNASLFRYRDSPEEIHGEY